RLRPRSGTVTKARGSANCGRATVARSFFMALELYHDAVCFGATCSRQCGPAFIEPRLIVPFTYAMNKSPENLEHIAALGFAQLGSMALLVPFIPVLLRYGECILLRDLVIAFDFQEAFNLVDRFVRREHGRTVAEPQCAFQ